MKNLLLIISLGLTLTSCGQESTFDQKIWIETNTMTVYDSSKEKLLTGKLRGEEDGKQFYGNIIKGKPDGTCYWLSSDSDTIQILRFKNGEKVFSQQFDQDGKKQGEEWSMKYIETKDLDEDFVSKVIEFLLTNRTDSIKSFYQPSNNIPELDLISDKIKRINESNGEVKEWEVSNIEKRKYAHRDELYIEAVTILKTEKSELKYNIRLLIEHKIIKSINFWEQDTDSVKNNFIKPDFFFFLRM